MKENINLIFIILIFITNFLLVDIYKGNRVEAGTSAMVARHSSHMKANEYLEQVLGIKIREEVNNYIYHVEKMKERQKWWKFMGSQFEEIIQSAQLGNIIRSKLEENKSYAPNGEVRHMIIYYIWNLLAKLEKKLFPESSSGEGPNGAFYIVEDGKRLSPGSTKWKSVKREEVLALLSKQQHSGKKVPPSACHRWEAKEGEVGSSERLNHWDLFAKEKVEIVDSPGCNEWDKPLDGEKLTIQSIGYRFNNSEDGTSGTRPPELRFTKQFKPFRYITYTELQWSEEEEKWEKATTKKRVLQSKTLHEGGMFQKRTLLGNSRARRSVLPPLAEQSHGSGQAKEEKEWFKGAGNPGDVIISGDNGKGITYRIDDVTRLKFRNMNASRPLLEWVQVRNRIEIGNIWRGDGVKNGEVIDVTSVGQSNRNGTLTSELHTTWQWSSQGEGGQWKRVIGEAGRNAKRKWIKEKLDEIEDE